MNLLIAQSLANPAPSRVWMCAASAAAGVSAGWFALVLLSIICRDVAGRAESWEFEKARRIGLRRDCLVYRLLEPLVDGITGLRPLHIVGNVARVRKNLLASASNLSWTAEEFLGVKAIQALAAGILVWLLLFWNDCPLVFATLVAGGVAIAYLRLAVGKLDRCARQRLARFKQRLPFGVDLIALMMAAGAGFRESLATLVEENENHPIGAEFGKVLRGLERGQSLRETLNGLQARLPDPDVKEMVFAIQKAEELGTPLSRVFFSMAEQMRLKRSQWAEKAAGKAQTMITFPGLVIMLACLLIVTAPFVIDALENSPF